MDSTEATRQLRCFLKRLASNNWTNFQLSVKHIQILFLFFFNFSISEIQHKKRFSPWILWYCRMCTYIEKRLWFIYQIRMWKPYVGEIFLFSILSTTIFFASHFIYQLYMEISWTASYSSCMMMIREGHTQTCII